MQVEGLDVLQLSISHHCVLLVGRQMLVTL